MAKQPAWTIDLGKGGKYTFTSAAEVRSWLEKDRDTWAAALQNTYKSVLAEYYQRVGVVISTQVLNDDADESDKRAALIMIGELYQTAVHHQSPRGRIAIEAGERHGALAAAGALSVFLQREFHWFQSPDFSRGVYAAITYERAEAKVTSSPATSFEQLHREIREWFGASKAEIAREHEASALHRAETSQTLSTLTAEMGALKAQTVGELEALAHETRLKYTSFLSESEVTFKKLIGDSTETIGSMVSESNKKLGVIEQTYNDKLSLQAPVTYWEERKAFHALRWKCWLGTFAGLVVLSGVVLYLFVTKVLPESATVQTFPIGRLVESIVFVMLGLWIIRTSARQYQLHLHLYTDASERAVMITTYLSLLRDNAGVKDNDRALILAAIFRAAAPPAGHEDANPPNVVTSLMNK